MQLIFAGQTLIALIFVVFFILRPLVKLILKEVGDQEAGGAPELLSVPDNQLENPKIPMVHKGSNEVEVVKNLASQDAKQFAELIRNWLK